MPEFSIRKYNVNDRNSLFKIGADTAFFGDQIEVYLDDRQLFLDSFYAYYTDIEPNYSWVAICEDQLIGFLTGCIDARKYQRDIYRIIIPRVIKKLFQGKYRIRYRSVSYFAGLLTAVLHGGHYSIDYNMYPAHLHINIDKKFRGFGLGKTLIHAYLEQLSSLKVRGVYLHTTSQNITAYKLYEKLGFKLLWYHPNHFWTKWFGYKVDILCYVRLIT
jgi:ribosomal protein S18 acetylase RimI-like enzyme